MSDVKPTARREKAAKTHRKIVQAALLEFLEKGFHGATIASIAARGGVAAQTVYFVFHTKAELISAVIDDAVMGDAGEIPEESEWWAEMVAAPDSAGALRAFIRGTAPLFARASAISDILRAAALTDDEVHATYEHHERMRRDGFRQALSAAAAKGALKSGLTMETATDLFLTLYGDTTFVLMTKELGWPEEQWVDWLCVEAPALLFAPVDPHS